MLRHRPPAHRTHLPELRPDRLIAPGEHFGTGDKRKKLFRETVENTQSAGLQGRLGPLVGRGKAGCDDYDARVWAGGLGHVDERALRRRVRDALNSAVPVDQVPYPAP